VHYQEIFKTPVSYWLFTCLLRVNHISSKRNRILCILFLSSNEPVIQNFSTILYIVLVCITVEVGFFNTKQTASLPTRCGSMWLFFLLGELEIFYGRNFDVETVVHSTVQKLFVIPETELMMYVQHLNKCW